MSNSFHYFHPICKENVGNLGNGLGSFCESTKNLSDTEITHSNNDEH